MSEEKVDLTKFVKGFVQPVEWWKAASTTLKIAVVVVIIYFVYQFFFAKKTVQTQNITAQPGSHVQITQTSKERKYFIPFVEGGIEQKSGTSRAGYVRAGLRFEF